MSSTRRPSKATPNSSEQTIGSLYDQVVYPSAAYSHSHPDRLATQAILHGMDPAPVDECRVLELGCSNGGNLVPMALSLPSSEFVGIDLSPRQIAGGLSQVEALGLRNIQLLCKSITDLGPEAGRFDYIIAHGVFSWVPRQVQDRILEVCRDHLTPNGVAYVSYNAYPGAHNLLLLREMMLYHTRNVENLEQRARRALDLVRFLAANRVRDDEPITFSLKVFRDTMEEVPDQLSFVVHEYLAKYNTPTYFHQFIERAEGVGLQYIADAAPASTSVDLLPDEVVAVLEEFSSDRLEREQYLDFLHCTSFRRSLLCHRDVSLQLNTARERLRRLFAAAPVKELASEGDHTSGQTFRIWTGRTHSFEHRPTITLLRRLSERWPEQIACAELIDSWQIEPTPEASADLLCSLFRSGFIELRSLPFDCVVRAGKRPRASLLARRQAEDGRFVTSQLHRTVKMEDEVGRLLLSQLDGSRDRGALAATLEQAVRDGRLTINYQDVPVLEHPDRQRILLDLVEDHLRKMTEVALLQGSEMDELERLNRALTLQGDGLFAEAAGHYAAVLENNPSRVDFIYLMGLTSLRDRSAGEHAAFFRRLVERHGSRLLLAPTDIDSHGMDAQRISSQCEGQILQDPKNVSARVRWGLLREQQGRFKEALDLYRQALDLRPRLPFLWPLVARSLLGMQRTEEAVQAFCRCLEPVLPFHEVLAGLGALFLWTDQTRQAAFYLKHASEKVPDDPIVLENLAEALYENGELMAALKCYDRVIGLGAASENTWYATGNALAAVGEYAQSLGAYRRSLEIDSANPSVHYNLGVALYRLGDVDAALDHLAAAAEQGMSEAFLAIATAIPGSPKSDQKRIRLERQRFAEQVAAAENPLPEPRLEVQGGDASRPLRVGYISSFFHKANYMKPVWGLLNNHDRNSFQIHLFSESPFGHVSTGYRANVQDRFHCTAGLSNRELAHHIREQRLDILVDLNAFSAADRLPLFPYRTAPLMLAWFNMYATSGFPVFDAIIGDEHVVRPGEEIFYIEQVVRLPVSYLSFTVDYPVPPVAPPPCLENGYLTFGCLGTQYKITPAVLESWAAILVQAPTARLFMANSILKSKVTGEDHLYPLFARHGIERKRLILSGPDDHFEFLRNYDRIDVALDTFPYNGGTTTMEAIWQGVPVLTFDGDRWASRTSASLLRNCHLGDFVAVDVEEYVARAVKLAMGSDTPVKLHALRTDMRARLQASSVCDTVALARHMEAAYRRLWQNKIHGLTSR